MNFGLENLIKNTSDQIPKAGVWIVLKNIELGLRILFETIKNIIALAVVLYGLWLVYSITPSPSASSKIITGN